MESGPGVRTMTTPGATNDVKLGWRKWIAVEFVGILALLAAVVGILIAVEHNYHSDTANQLSQIDERLDNYYGDLSRRLDIYNGDQERRVDTSNGRVDGISGRIDGFQRRLQDLDTEEVSVKADVDSVKADVKGVKTRVDDVEKKEVQARLPSVEDEQNFLASPVFLNNGLVVQAKSGGVLVRKRLTERENELLMQQGKELPEHSLIYNEDGRLYMVRNQRSRHGSSLISELKRSGIIDPTF
jgi:hypothetical protein